MLFRIFFQAKLLLKNLYYQSHTLLVRFIDPKYTKKQSTIWYIEKDGEILLKKSYKIWKIIIPENIKNYLQIVRQLDLSGYLR